MPIELIKSKNGNSSIKLSSICTLDMNPCFMYGDACPSNYGIATGTSTNSY